MVQHFSAAVLFGLVSCLTGAAAEPAGRIRGILIDGQNNHNWRATTPLLKRELENCGRIAVTVSSHLKPGDQPGLVAEAVAFPPDLSRYEVLLSNYNGAAWPEAFRKDLETRLHEGKIGLVIVHAANNAFDSWDEYNTMIGMGWRHSSFGDRLILDPAGKEVRIPKGKGPGAGHGARHIFTVTVRDVDHPVTHGMPREWRHMTDESYHGMRGPIANVHLLATAYSDRSRGGTGEQEPMIWTVSYGKGRVFHTPMGHDIEAMRCKGFMATVQRGTEWAATGKVTLLLPPDFPSATNTSALP